MVKSLENLEKWKGSEHGPTENVFNGGADDFCCWQCASGRERKRSRLCDLHFAVWSLLGVVI